MNIMTYYIIYMTYEISLTIIYNCILNLVNKTGFQADSQSRLRSRLPPEPFVPLARLGSAQKWNRTEPKKSTRVAQFWAFPIPRRRTEKLEDYQPVKISLKSDILGIDFLEKELPK